MRRLWIRMGKWCSLAFACCSVLAACAVHEERLNVPRLEQTNSGTLEWKVLIEKDRGRAFVSLRNSGSYAVQCDQLGFRTILDFPVSYLEAGEFATTEFNRFVPAGESVEFAPVVISDSERQIRSVQGERFDRCRLASFGDACRATQDISSYREMFALLVDLFDADGCSDLETILRDERVLDLRGTPGVNLDPLELLSFGIAVLLLDRDVSSMKGETMRSGSSRHQVLVVSDVCSDEDLEGLWRNSDCFPE